MSMARMVVVLACLALAACSSVKKAEETGKAGGQVLPGSISDAMIDLDQSRAEAPLAAPGTIANPAARGLIAGLRADRIDEAGAEASDAPGADQTAKFPDAADAAVPHDKPVEKGGAPALAPKSTPAKLAPVVPLKPKAKPAFHKPTDDSGV